VRAAEPVRASSRVVAHETVFGAGLRRPRGSFVDLREQLPRPGIDEPYWARSETRSRHEQYGREWGLRRHPGRTRARLDGVPSPSRLTDGSLVPASPRQPWPRAGPRCGSGCCLRSNQLPLRRGERQPAARYGHAAPSRW
jgi:hypothetical protein